MRAGGFGGSFDCEGSCGPEARAPAGGHFASIFFTTSVTSARLTGWLLGVARLVAAPIPSFAFYSSSLSPPVDLLAWCAVSTAREVSRATQTDPDRRHRADRGALARAGADGETAGRSVRRPAAELLAR